MTKTKRTGGMVLGILFIGLCVSFLRLSQFGVDPFSAMNLGISGFIGWSFGTWQLLVNAIILVVVFFQARSCIGAGTIINMVFVGYIADFICYVANDVVQIQMNLPLRYPCTAACSADGIYGSGIIYGRRYGNRSI